MSDKRTNISSELTLKPRDVTEALKFLMLAKRPAFIWGQPGIGKSDIISQLAAGSNRPMIDIRLLLCDPTDLKGIPHLDQVIGTMRFAQPCELPANVSVDQVNRAKTVVERLSKVLGSSEDPAQQVEYENLLHNAARNLEYLEKNYDLRNAILFLDEFNAAPPSVQGAAYQLILNRRIGEYVLPDGVDMFAAGNRENDKGVTYRMPTPLCNRFVHINMEPDTEDWLLWAMANNIHSSVIGFIGTNKQKLNMFDPRSPDKAFATSRTWVFVSDMLHVSDSGKAVKPNVMQALIAGTVGSGLSIEFEQHQRLLGQLPKPDDILLGSATKMDTREVSAHYTIVLSLCHTLREILAAAKTKDIYAGKKMSMEVYHAAVDKFVTFIMANVSDEMTVLAMRSAMGSYKLIIDPSEQKSIKIFLSKFKDFILGN